MFGFLKVDILHLKIYTNKIDIRILDSDLEISENSLNKFSTDRLILADYLSAEKFITSLISKLYKDKKMTPRLHILIQVMEKMEDGISPVEERAFLDLGEHCGGYKVVVYDNSKPLLDSQIKELLK